MTKCSVMFSNISPVKMVLWVGPLWFFLIFFIYLQFYNGKFENFFFILFQDVENYIEHHRFVCVVVFFFFKKNVKGLKGQTSGVWKSLCRFSQYNHLSCILSLFWTAFVLSRLCVCYFSAWGFPIVVWSVLNLAADGL